MIMDPSLDWILRSRAEIEEIEVEGGEKAFEEVDLSVLMGGERSTESASSSAFTLTFALISFMVPSLISSFIPSSTGPDQRLRDRVGGRRGLLPGLQRDHLGGQCRERAPLHAAPGADHTEKHIGHKEPPRDPERQGEHLGLHAGEIK